MFGKATLFECVHAALGAFRFARGCFLWALWVWSFVIPSFAGIEVQGVVETHSGDSAFRPAWEFTARRSARRWWIRMEPAPESATGWKNFWIETGSDGVDVYKAFWRKPKLQDETDAQPVVDVSEIDHEAVREAMGEYIRLMKDLGPTNLVGNPEFEEAQKRLDMVMPDFPPTRPVRTEPWFTGGRVEPGRIPGWDRRWDPVAVVWAPLFEDAFPEGALGADIETPNLFRKEPTKTFVDTEWTRVARTLSRSDNERLIQWSEGDFYWAWRTSEPDEHEGYPFWRSFALERRWWDYVNQREEVKQAFRGRITSYRTIPDEDVALPAVTAGVWVTDCRFAGPLVKYTLFELEEDQWMSREAVEASVSFQVRERMRFKTALFGLLRLHWTDDNRAAFRETFSLGRFFYVIGVYLIFLVVIVGWLWSGLNTFMKMRALHRDTSNPRAYDSECDQSQK